MTTTTATQMPGAYDIGIAAITGSRTFINGLIAGMSDEQLIAQPCKDGNHIIWQLGHLAYTDDYFHATLSGTPTAFDDRWTGLFGMGSQPSPEISSYPPLSEVRATFESTRDALLDWFASLSEKQQAEPLSDDLQGFARTKVELMTALAGHEMMHAGQITVIRKSLGLKPKFM